MARVPRCGLRTRVPPAQAQEIQFGLKGGDTRMTEERAGLPAYERPEVTSFSEEELAESIEALGMPSGGPSPP
nr:hypothetical protein Hi04_10k_c1889_00027 [uncultured bacterium]